MDEFDYKPNSHKYKEQQAAAAKEKKKVEKVVHGKVKTKKKNEIRKFADIFVAEDVSNVKSFILMDVLVPAIKKAIVDIVTNGVDMMLYGEARGGKKRTSGDYVSYRDYSNRDRRDRRDTRSSSQFDYDDLVFESRGEAEAIREQMDDLIDRYGMVTVADFYDLAGITAPYTSNRYGWTSIRNAEPVRNRDGGYSLKLPKAMLID